MGLGTNVPRHGSLRMDVRRVQRRGREAKQPPTARHGQDLLDDSSPRPKHWKRMQPHVPRQRPQGLLLQLGCFVPKTKLRRMRGRLIIFQLTDLNHPPGGAFKTPSMWCQSPFAFAYPKKIRRPIVSPRPERVAASRRPDPSLSPTSKTNPSTFLK